MENPLPRQGIFCEGNMRKIYFAGSIRGGREDAALYREIIAYLQRTDRVLTEHIGREDLERAEANVTDADIYNMDTAWLRESDLVIAECTRPSLGVGYELAYAEAHDKPCHLLYRPSACRLSAMLTGNAYYKIYPYETMAELFAILDKILA